LKRLKKEQILMPFGMIGVLSYLGHTLLGDFLFEAHNPITMRIERLLSTQSSYTYILALLIAFYSICMLLFAGGMYIQSAKSYAKTTKVMYLVIFLPMQLIFLITSLISTNLYIYLAIITVMLSIAYSYFMMREYLKHEYLKGFGRAMLVFSILITILGFFFMSSLVFDFEKVGMAQRLFVFCMMAIIFSISNFESFFDKEAAEKYYKDGRF